jgi:hypothetical protein
MSSASAISPSHPESEDWWPKETSRMAMRVCNVGSFIRSLRGLMRFGDLTRAPLHMLRLQLKGRVAECDWLARPSDPWDAGLRAEIGQQHASIQALRDAVEVRTLLFSMLPDVDAAYLRVYRDAAAKDRELIIAGHVHRQAASFRNVHSIAMRAKLLGFRFSLENDILYAKEEISNLELVNW